jgi:hypothetical protein
MNAILIGIIGGAIGGPLAVALVIGARLLRPQKCPDCGTSLPNLGSRADLERGYRPCLRCGCQVDYSGKKVEGRA